jgi:hypothetical protein
MIRRMRAGIHYFMGTLLLTTSLAHAAKMDPAHRARVVQSCVTTYQSMPPVPPAMAARIPALQYRDNPAQLRKWCECHTDAYHAQMSQADYDGFQRESLTGGTGPASERVRVEAVARAKRADAQCAKLP